jgi:N-acetylneuraminate synthase
MYVFPEHQKSKRRDTPWGEMSYLEYKYRIKFNEEQIQELCKFSKLIGIEFFSSVWDLDSVAIMAKYTKIGKIGSALITDLELCKAT